jgi:hypothetical protein
VSGLSANTAYKFLEKTKDTQGNESDFSTASSWVYTQVASSATVVSSTSITVTASQPTVVLDGNPDSGLSSGVSSVSIPTTIAPTTAVTLDLSRGLSSQQTTVPSAITVTRQSSDSATAYTLFIPASTVITAASNAWDGKVTLPTNISSSGVSTNRGDVQNAVEVGSSIRLDFDKAVKLLIPGGADKRAAYINSNGDTVDISLRCNSTTDSSNIVGSGECYAQSGSDMIIWTKHFTTYFTYTPYESLSSTLTPQYIQTQIFVSPNPSRPVVIINGGSRQTATTSVSLEFNLVGAATMLISNSSDFVSAIAVPFLSARSWILTPGNGLKTVYVRFKTADGVSTDALGTIQLVGQATDQQKDPDIGTAVIRPERKFKPQIGTLAKESVNPATYIFFADTWHLIATEILFNKLKYSWSWIKTITQEEFTAYNTGRPIKTATDPDLPKLQQVKQAADPNNTTSSSTIKNVAIGSIPTSTRKFGYTFTKNLYQGDSGSDVRSLQDILYTLGYLKTASTGYYGLQTVRAVQAFQKQFKIPATGTVGPKTREVINSL